MEPDDRHEGSPHRFGPPWSGLGDAFRNRHEQDEARPHGAPGRLLPGDFFPLKRWELRCADWIALRLN